MLPILIRARKDVTIFLGIPVDGTKVEMIKKLKEKGFVYNERYKWLEGEFNGKRVNISIGTNREKVYRIMVVDDYGSKAEEIKNRFNRLCRQFENNKKYYSLDSISDMVIPDWEDVRYEMSIHKKQYQASFVQRPESIDTVEIAEQARKELLEKYELDQLLAPTEEIAAEMYKSYLLKLSEVILKKSVWFTISEYGIDDYRIVLYYDNKDNEANGEDL